MGIKTAGIGFKLYARHPVVENGTMEGGNQSLFFFEQELIQFRIETLVRVELSDQCSTKNKLHIPAQLKI